MKRAFMFATTACAALAAAPPSWAWDASKCRSQPNAAAFRNFLGDKLLNQTFDRKGRPTSPTPDDTFKMIAPCRDSVPAPQQGAFDACVLRARNYAELLKRPGLGLKVDNDKFHADYGGILAIPDKLKDQQLFTLLQATNLADLTSVNATVSRIKTLIPTAIVLPYVSPTTPSIDPTNSNDRHGRIVVWVGDGDVSRYIQFTVNANANSPSTTPRTQASVVNVKLKDPNKGAYIFDWERSNPAGHTFNYNTAFGNNQHCYGCHANGVLAIHPFESEWAQPSGGPNDDVGGVAATLGPDYEKWLDKVNEAYLQSALEMNNQIDKDWGGAAAGTVAQAPTKADVGNSVPDTLVAPTSSACTNAVAALRPRAELNTSEWARDWTNYAVSYLPGFSYTPTQGQEYRCTTCHNNRGKTVYDPAVYSDIMTKYVEGGFMPPDLPSYLYQNKRVVLKNSVPLDTRTKALQCFQEDIEARMKNWIENTTCP